MLVWITYIVILIILILLSRTSGYTTSTPDADKVSQPINIGKDIDPANTTLWSPTTYKLQDSSVSLLSWTQLNNMMWNMPGVVGFRKELSLQGGGNVYLLYTAPTVANMTRDATSIDTITLSDGKRYAVPNVVIALKSVADIKEATDCVYTVTQGTSCSATACGTTGTYTDTVNITQPPVAEGKCSYTQGQELKTRSCSAPSCAVPCVYTVIEGTSCSATACGTTGTYTDTVKITTPASGGAICAVKDGETRNTRACSAPACSWVPGGYFTGTVKEAALSQTRTIVSVSTPSKLSDLSFAKILAAIPSAAGVSAAQVLANQTDNTFTILGSDLTSDQQTAVTAVIKVTIPLTMRSSTTVTYTKT
jgi:hypothetical protein